MHVELTFVLSDSAPSSTVHLNWFSVIESFFPSSHILTPKLHFLPTIAWVSQGSLNAIWNIGKEQVGEIGEDWAPDPRTVGKYKYVLQNEE